VQKGEKNLMQRLPEKTSMRVLLLAGVMALLVALLAAPALAAANPMGTGQPSQSCQDLGQTFPGDSGGFEKATLKYAGSQPQNSSNPKSVSQYDVACFQASEH
jgi:hypothetical protein